MFNFQRPVDCALNDWQIVFRAKFQLVADPLPLFAVPSYDFRVEILLHGKSADFDKLDHNREAGERAFIFNIGKIWEYCPLSVSRYHVSMGLSLWGYEVRQGTVLYLALEDNHRRLQERLYRMFGVESTGNLFFAIGAKQLGGGLEEQLKGFVREHTDTRLIIIDTLQKIREAGAEKYSYANDYEVITN